MRAVTAVLSSPRRRRRLFWLAALGAVAAGVALTVVYLRNTAPSYDRPLSGDEAELAEEPTVSALTPQARAAARATAYNFVRTAVVRENLRESWQLVHPRLKEGFTIERWVKGDIPVIPYPADLKRARYGVEYSYDDVLGMAVALWPKPGANADPLVFRMELKKTGPAARRHWVVYSWAPPGVPLEVIMQRAQQAAARRGTPITAETARGNTLSAYWLAVPGAVLLLVFLVPVALVARGWHRERRAHRRYHAEFRR